MSAYHESEKIDYSKQRETNEFYQYLRQMYETNKEDIGKIFGPEDPVEHQELFTEIFPYVYEGYLPYDTLVRLIGYKEEIDSIIKEIDQTMNTHGYIEDSLYQKIGTRLFNFEETKTILAGKLIYEWRTNQITAQKFKERFDDLDSLAKLAEDAKAKQIEENAKSMLGNHFSANAPLLLDYVGKPKEINMIEILELIKSKIPDDDKRIKNVIDQIMQDYKALNIISPNLRMIILPNLNVFNSDAGGLYITKEQLNYQHNIPEIWKEYDSDLIVVNGINEIEQVIKIIFHEIIHAYSYNLYNQDETFRQEINELYNYAKSIIYDSPDYGFTKPIEFITEGISNNRLASILLRTRYEPYRESRIYDVSENVVSGNLHERLVDIWTDAYYRNYETNKLNQEKESSIAQQQAKNWLKTTIRSIASIIDPHGCSECSRLVHDVEEAISRLRNAQNSAEYESALNEINALLDREMENRVVQTSADATSTIAQHEVTVNGLPVGTLAPPLHVTAEQVLNKIDIAINAAEARLYFDKEESSRTELLVLNFLIDALKSLKKNHVSAEEIEQILKETELVLPEYQITLEEKQILLQDFNIDESTLSVLGRFYIPSNKIKSLVPWSYIEEKVKIKGYQPDELAVFLIPLHDENINVPNYKKIIQPMTHLSKKDYEYIDSQITSNFRHSLQYTKKYLLIAFTKDGHIIQQYANRGMVNYRGEFTESYYEREHGLSLINEILRNYGMVEDLEILNAEQHPWFINSLILTREENQFSNELSNWQKTALSIYAQTLSDNMKYAGFDSEISEAIKNDLLNIRKRPIFLRSPSEFPKRISPILSLTAPFTSISRYIHNKLYPEDILIPNFKSYEELKYLMEKNILPNILNKYGLSIKTLKERIYILGDTYQSRYIYEPKHYSNEDWHSLSTRMKAESVVAFYRTYFTEDQYEAIEKAHQIGLSEERYLGPRREDGTYSFREGTYTAEDIREKQKILREAGIDENLITALMNYGVVGNEESSLVQKDAEIAKSQALNQIDTETKQLGIRKFESLGLLKELFSEQEYSEIVERLGIEEKIRREIVFNDAITKANEDYAKYKQLERESKPNIIRRIFDEGLISIFRRTEKVDVKEVLNSKRIYAPTAALYGLIEYKLSNKGMEINEENIIKEYNIWIESIDYTEIKEESEFVKEVIERQKIRINKKINEAIERFILSTDFHEKSRRAIEILELGKIYPNEVIEKIREILISEIDTDILINVIEIIEKLTITHPEITVKALPELKQILISNEDYYIKSICSNLILKIADKYPEESLPALYLILQDIHHKEKVFRILINFAYKTEPIKAIPILKELLLASLETNQFNLVSELIKDILRTHPDEVIKILPELKQELISSKTYNDVKIYNIISILKQIAKTHPEEAVKILPELSQAIISGPDRFEAFNYYPAYALELIGKIGETYPSEASNELLKILISDVNTGIKKLTMNQIEKVAIGFYLSLKEFEIHNIESLVELLEKAKILYYQYGIIPTKYLLDNYDESVLDEWKKTYDDIISERIRLDPNNKLHQELMYTQFRQAVDCCFSRPEKYTYDNYISIYDNTDLYASKTLSGEQQSELIYAGYESFRTFEAITRIAKNVKESGRKVLVVPNYSYGRFVIEPIGKELEKNDIEVKPARIGSTEAHSDDYLISAENRNQLFDEEMIIQILRERPVIVMVDGSNSYARGRDARYPDAQKGYVNFALVMNIAIRDYLLSRAQTEYEKREIISSYKQVQKYRTDEHLETLERVHESTIKYYVKLLEDINSDSLDFFEINYWNPAGTSLAVTQGLHETRTVVEEIKPANLDEIKGASMVIVNSVFNDGFKDVFLPSEIKEKGDNKEHESAYFDDTAHIQDIIFKLGSHGVEITDEIYKKIRQEFLEFYYQDSPIYKNVVETGLLTLNQATDMRLHRIKDINTLRGKLHRRDIQLSENDIEIIFNIITSSEHTVIGNYRLIEEFEDTRTELERLGEVEQKVAEEKKVTSSDIEEVAFNQILTLEDLSTSNVRDVLEKDQGRAVERVEQEVSSRIDDVMQILLVSGEALVDGVQIRIAELPANEIAKAEQIDSNWIITVDKAKIDSLQLDDAQKQQALRAVVAHELAEISAMQNGFEQGAESHIVASTVTKNILRDTVSNEDYAKIKGKLNELASILIDAERHYDEVGHSLIGIQGDVKALRETLDYIHAHTGDTERGVVKLTKQLRPNDLDLQNAALLHDIGKAGPPELPDNMIGAIAKAEELAHDAVSKLFGIQGVKSTSEIRIGKFTSIKDFLDVSIEQGKLSENEKQHTLNGLTLIINPFTGEFFSEQDTMGDFWDSHSLWSVQRLKKAGVQREIIDIVSQHHKIDVYRNLDDSITSVIIDIDVDQETIKRIPTENAVDEQKIMSEQGKILLLLDKYNAFVERSEMSENDALNVINKIISDSILEEDDFKHIIQEIKDELSIKQDVSKQKDEEAVEEKQSIWQRIADSKIISGIRSLFTRGDSVVAPYEYTTEQWSSMTTEQKAKSVALLSGITFTPEQIKAIEKAHQIGLSEERYLGPRHEDGTYSFREGTYTAEDIREKQEILREAGIDENIITALMDYGVVGNEETQKNKEEFLRLLEQTRAGDENARAALSKLGIRITDNGDFLIREDGILIDLNNLVETEINEFFGIDISIYDGVNTVLYLNNEETFAIAFKIDSEVKQDEEHEYVSEHRVASIDSKIQDILTTSNIYSDIVSEEEQLLSLRTIDYQAFDIAMRNRYHHITNEESRQAKARNIEEFRNDVLADHPDLDQDSIDSLVEELSESIEQTFPKRFYTHTTGISSLESIIGDLAIKGSAEVSRRDSLKGAFKNTFTFLMDPGSISYGEVMIIIPEFKIPSDSAYLPGDLPNGVQKSNAKRDKTISFGSKAQQAMKADEANEAFNHFVAIQIIASYLNKGYTLDEIPTTVSGEDLLRYHASKPAVGSARIDDEASLGRIETRSDRISLISTENKVEDNIVIVIDKRNKHVIEQFRDIIKSNNIHIILTSEGMGILEEGKKRPSNADSFARARIFGYFAGYEDGLLIEVEPNIYELSLEQKVRDSIKISEKLIPTPLLDGDDIKEIFGVEGPTIRIYIDKLKELQANGKVSTKEEAISELMKITPN